MEKYSLRKSVLNGYFAMRFFLIILILFLGFNISGQQFNNTKIIEIQDKIAKLIGELKKETSVNYMKHFNQVEGFKQGLWIESTNGYLWFINYKGGLKDGNMLIYYTSGIKHVEAKYKDGFLIEKVVFYDTKGVVEQTYENITLNDSIVERKIESVEGGRIYFSKDKHKFDYKAYIKRYTSEGVLYKEGYGLFDDNWIFKMQPIGEWKGNELQ